MSKFVVILCYQEKILSDISITNYTKLAIQKEILQSSS